MASKGNKKTPLGTHLLAGGVSWAIHLVGGASSCSHIMLKYVYLPLFWPICTRLTVVISYNAMERVICESNRSQVLAKRWYAILWIQSSKLHAPHLHRAAAN